MMVVASSAHCKLNSKQFDLDGCCATCEPAMQHMARVRSRRFCVNLDVICIWTA